MHTAKSTERNCIMAIKKQTSPKVATQESKALKDGRSSARTKSIAESALSQAQGKRSKKK